MVDVTLRHRIVEALRGSGVRGIQCAWLFGSHSEGRAHADSDIDVAVLLSRSEHATSAARFDVRVRLSAALEGVQPGAHADVIAIQDVPATLGRKVVQDGVLLFSTDAEAEHAFRRDAQLRAADLDPWLARMRRIALGALEDR